MSNITKIDKKEPLTVTFKKDTKEIVRKDTQLFNPTKEQREFLANNTCKGVCHHKPCGKKATQEVEMGACACRTAGKYWLCDACAAEYQERPNPAEIIRSFLFGK